MGALLPLCINSAVVQAAGLVRDLFTCGPHNNLPWLNLTSHELQWIHSLALTSCIFVAGSFAPLNKSFVKYPWPLQDHRAELECAPLTLPLSFKPQVGSVFASKHFLIDHNLEKLSSPWPLSWQCSLIKHQGRTITENQSLTFSNCGTISHIRVQVQVTSLHSYFSLVLAFPPKSVVTS